MGYLNHLTVLEQTVKKHPYNVAFKIPGKDGRGWQDISYEVFWDDITRFAAHWLDKLKGKGDYSISKREVIGLWYVRFVSLDHNSCSSKDEWQNVR